MDYFDKAKERIDHEDIKIQLKQEEMSLLEELNQLTTQYRQSKVLQEQRNLLKQRFFDDFRTYFESKDYQINNKKNVNSDEVIASYGTNESNILKIELTNIDNEPTIQLTFPKKYAYVIEIIEISDDSLKYFGRFSEDRSNIEYLGANKDNSIEFVNKQIATIKDDIEYMHETLENLEGIEYVYSIYDSKFSSSEPIKVIEYISKDIVNY